MAVEGFWIQEHEVTNREYRRLVPGTTPVNEESRGIRGGSFRSPPFFLRASNRSNVFCFGTAYDDIGFRGVWPAGSGGD